MKKSKKTYAILNLAEKHTIFHLGKTRVHVSFTGGQVTKTGVTPATFTTDNPIVQLAIENSPDYKKGAVRLLSEYPAEGEVMIGMNPPEPPSPLKEELSASAFLSESRASASGSPVEPPAPAGLSEVNASLLPLDPRLSTENPEAPEMSPAPEPSAFLSEHRASASGSPASSSDSCDPGNLEVIEVSCKDVAKQYLQEHYGEKPAPLRTIANIQECAAKYGITFSFV